MSKMHRISKKKAERIERDARQVIEWLERTLYIVKQPKQIAFGTQIPYRRVLEALNAIAHIQQMNPTSTPVMRFTGTQYQRFFWLVSRDEGRK